MKIFTLFFNDAFYYLAIYIWLFAISTLELCLPINRSAKLIFAKISLIGLALILGLRWETGTDWQPYFELFKSIELNSSSLLAIYGFDIGYVFLNGLIRLFSDSYTIFLLINSIISISLIYIFVKLCSPFPNTSILIFFVSYFVPHFMGSNRRVIAIGFMLMAFINTQKLRRLSIASLLFLAAAFHRTSIIGIFGLLAPSRYFTRKQTALLLGTCLTLGASFQLAGEIQRLGEFLSQYINLELIEKMIFYGDTADQHGSENVDEFTQTVLALLKRSIFLILFYATIRRTDGPGIQAKLFNIYIISFSIYTLFGSAPIFRVLSNYFSIVEIALIGMSAAYLRRSHRPIFSVFLFFYGLVQLASALTPYPELYIPYISIFSDEKRLIRY